MKGISIAIILGCLGGLAWANINSNVALSGSDFTNGISALSQENALNLNEIYSVMGVPQGATVQSLSFYPIQNRAMVTYIIVDNQQTNGN